MSNQTTSNSSRLLIIGAAVLLVGVILVLVVLRSGIGDDGAQPAAQPNVSDSTSPAPPPDPRAGLVSSEQAATARLADPLTVEQGYEAAALRVTFIRGVAAVVVPGDRLNLYSLAPGAGQIPVAQPQPQQPAEGESEASETPTTPAVLPTPTAATRVLTDIEVLGIIGPRPAANDGVLTLLLAVPTDSVETTLELANNGLLWATLLPSPDEPTDVASGAEASEGASS